jgi:hypothetical protein
MNVYKTIWYQNIIARFPDVSVTKIFGYFCSFKTIPNGLRQHPLAVAIIHSASIGALRGKLPDPSIIL